MSNFATEIAKYLHEWTQNGDKTGVKFGDNQSFNKKSCIFTHIICTFAPTNQESPDSTVEGIRIQTDTRGGR